jgi:hypothetical protein
MVRVLFAALVLAAFAVTHASALDMNVKVDNTTKFAYVNMWGEIQPGDDNKFRQIVLPYVRSGYTIFKINIFSIGGDVAAAMGLADQIRMLQARTVAPSYEAIIVDNQQVKTHNPLCSLDEGNGQGVWPQFVRGQRWCTCESACFLIWASGSVREGSVIGIHRLYWKGANFGNLPADTARAQYETAQAHYTAYLKKLDVPETIVERLFATDSHSMYFLTWPEVQLMESTPYLEEMAYSRCGADKTEHASAANNWTETQDIQHVYCVQGILKEIMIDGARKYLATYSDGATVVVPEPAPTTAPTAPGMGGPFVPVPIAPKPTDKYWDHNGSQMDLETDGPTRKFVYRTPRAALIQAGVRTGTVLFDGKRAGDQYSGIAYLFSGSCGKRSYRVSGPVSDDQRSVTMQGKKPILSARCRGEGYQEDTLVFNYQVP